MKFVIPSLAISIFCVSCGSIAVDPTFSDVDPVHYTQNTTPYNVENKQCITISIPDQISNHDQPILCASTHFDSIRVVRLDSHNEAILGAINKIVELPDRLIISDARIHRTVKSFDRNGKYLCSYGSKGKGAGQYTEVTSFAVHDNKVKIYDIYQRKISTFNIDGRHIDDKLAPFIFRDFTIMNDNCYVFRYDIDDNEHLPAIMEHMIMETDSNFVVARRGLFRRLDSYPSYQIPLHCNSTSNLVALTFIDTVYQITPSGELNARYFIDYRARKVQPELLESSNEEKRLNILNTDSTVISSSNEMFDLDHYFVFKFRIAGRVHTAFYDKSTEALTTYMATRDGETLFFGGANFVYGDKNYLIGAYDAQGIAQKHSRIIEATAQPDVSKTDLDNFNSCYASHLRAAEGIKEDDNLVLVYYYLGKPSSDPLGAKTKCERGL